jgi:hypothetical protein
MIIMAYIKNRAKLLHYLCLRRSSGLQRPVNTRASEEPAASRCQCFRVTGSSSDSSPPPETLVSSCKPTQCCNSEDQHGNLHRRKNLKSYIACVSIYLMFVTKYRVVNQPLLLDWLWRTLHSKICQWWNDPNMKLATHIRLLSRDRMR